MVDIKAVRQDPEGIATALAKRGFDFDVAQFTALDARRKQADIDSQNLQAERKKASKQIGALIGQGMGVDEAKAQVNEALEKIAAQLDELTEQAKSAQAALEELLLGVPNIPAAEVPEGAGEEDNVEVARWGEPRTLSFTPRDHVEVGEALGELDFETAGRITGSPVTRKYSARKIKACPRCQVENPGSTHSSDIISALSEAEGIRAWASACRRARKES